MSAATTWCFCTICSSNCRSSSRLMTPGRLHLITEKIPPLRVAAVGDICLDRYLIIDESKAELSIETELPVRNVVEVRSQPGGAGTIINNLLALGVGKI